MKYHLHKKHLRGLTMMELITVVIIVGVLTSFAVPNYTRTIERAHLRDAEANLLSIHAANQIFRSENGAFWPNPGPAQNLSAINTGLRLAIVANDLEYSCQRIGVGYRCDACYPNCGASEKFTVTVTNAPIAAGNPDCNGTCP